jgi:Fe-Mn family superoxide dismutase
MSSSMMGVQAIVDDKGVPILGLDVWEHAYYLKCADLFPACWHVLST